MPYTALTAYAVEEIEATGEDEKAEVSLEGYELVAESDTYKMYLMASRLSIILENKETGEMLESTLSEANDDGLNNETWNGYMKSGIVIQAIIGTTNTYQVDLLTCENTVDVTKNDNGFSAKITFPEYGFELTVDVTLDGDDLVAGIKDSSIVESKEGTYISGISLFPFMGYTHNDDEEGYMLIPDGNGALVYLDDKEGRYSTGFSQMIYGTDSGFAQSGITTYLWDEIEMVRDANQVIAPVFGMAHSGQQLGYIAVVEQGEKRASIEVQPNGVMVNYNRCFAKFLLRDIYNQPLNQSNSGTVQSVEADRTHSDLQVRYMLLEGEDANYSGMANAYRDYLLDNSLVSVKDTSYNTRVDFLGTDREEFLMGTTAVTVTTVDNIEEIYDELQANGVSSLLSVYQGWQKGGVYNLPITKYKADGNIGGTSALTDLISESALEGYDLYLANDALRINPSTNTATYSSAKMVNKRTFSEELPYENVYKEFMYQITSKTDENLDKFVSSYTKKGVNNLALEGITNTLFSSYRQGTYYTRYDCADSYLDTIASVDESTNLILDQPFAYLWGNTDAFLNMPLGSSDYMYVDEEVPFLSMVLKGIIPMYSDYVNFEANKNEFFLQMIEAGVYPSFYVTYENSSALIYTNSSNLYSTEYATYADTIVEYDQAFRELAEKTADANIVAHEKLEEGATRVTYSNGVKVYVNYTDSDVTVDGITIPSMSYEVGV